MKTSSSEFSIPETVRYFQPIWDNFPRRFPATSQWLKEITLWIKGHSSKSMKEPQTVHSHRGPESAGARWIFGAWPPRRKRVGCHSIPLPRAGVVTGPLLEQGRGSPAPPRLRPKGLGPQALAPHLQVTIPQLWGQVTRGTSQIPGWLCKEQHWQHVTTFFLGTSPRLTLNQPSVPLPGVDTGKWTGPKSRWGRGESTGLQCWARAVLPRLPRSPEPGREEPALQTAGRGDF